VLQEGWEQCAGVKAASRLRSFTTWQFQRRKDQRDNGIEFHHSSLLAGVSLRLFKDGVDGGGGSKCFP